MLIPETNYNTICMLENKFLWHFSQESDGYSQPTLVLEDFAVPCGYPGPH